jgi:cyclopropane-fatty-acyl-phospholipid synthase
VLKGGTFMRLLDPVLSARVRTGTLHVIDWRGQRTRYGSGAPEITVRVHDRATGIRLLVDPELAAGEAFMDGTLTVEQGDIYGLLDLVLSNSGWHYPDFPSRVGARLRKLGRRLAQYNPAHRSKRNVAHHYDLSDELYDVFLDADRQYSCAYFLSPDDTIETAQAQKKRHVAAKLLLEPGQRVLDIGSGWGGLALYLNEVADVDVTGLTLSEEQHRTSRERAASAGRGDKVRFLLRDYRMAEGTFDRIVSVGMFEHVGVNHFDEYFQSIARLLADDGVALVHAIGRADGPGTTNPWIQRYIFPGGYSPALSEVLPAIERAGLHVTDIEILRLHYAETLKRWRARFNANRDRITQLYDERFCRMWEFYLAASEATFRHGGHMVFQIQLAKKVDTVPLTRDYIGRFEAEHPLEGTIQRQAAE